VPEGRPRLEVVPGGSGPAEQAPREVPAAGGSRLAWGLAALLLLALVALAVQTQRAGSFAAEARGLRSELTQLSAELADTQERLELQRRRMDEVRAAVDRLQELVSRDLEPSAEPL
jgi:hypothetical protein